MITHTQHKFAFKDFKMHIHSLWVCIKFKIQEYTQYTHTRFQVATVFMQKDTKFDHYKTTPTQICINLQISRYIYTYEQLKQLLGFLAHVQTRSISHLLFLFCQPTGVQYARPPKTVGRRPISCLGSLVVNYFFKYI